MNQLSRNQKLILATLLVGFALAKIAAIVWWQQQPGTNTNKAISSTSLSSTSQCAVRQGCTLSNGAHIIFGPQSNAKTPFDIHIQNLPEQTHQVTVSFSMRDMDMGFNRYNLQQQSDGSWLGQQIRLPVCIDNRNDYLANIVIDGQTHTLAFGIP